MAKTVVMPQMGESVAEGTIVRWLKRVGDQVERDEPLFEISTDKVDAEIPSPSAGVVSDIKVKEGETVPINTVVAVIDESAAGVASKPAEKAAAPAPPASVPPSTAPQPAPPSQPKAASPAPRAPEPASTPSGSAEVPASDPPTESPAPSRVPPAEKAAAPEGSTPRAAAISTPSAIAPGSWSAAEARELRLSPVVRKIARDHHVDVRSIAGSGSGGRVTKADILAFIDAGMPATPGRPAPAAAPARAQTGELLQSNPAATAGLDPARFDRRPMTVMRRKIAEHMVLSKRTSPHVHSAFEIDFTKVDTIRRTRKDEFEKAGGKLTYMSFITRACAMALKAVPVVNASVDGADIIFKKEINVGVAVALDWGLIVPVVKNADTLGLLEISKAIADLAARAREKKLKPEEVQGGTFTITNPGVFGALFGMPIISQPQVAIVGVGAVEKRPVVIDDGIAIRLRAYMTIGYDHRIIDGAIADEFMQHVKKTIENWAPESV